MTTGTWMTVTYDATETRRECYCGHVDRLPPVTTVIELDNARCPGGETCNGCGWRGWVKKVITPELAAAIVATYAEITVA